MNDGLTAQSFDDPDFDGNEKASTVDPSTEPSTVPDQPNDSSPGAIKVEPEVSSQDAIADTVATPQVDSKPQPPASNDPPEIEKSALPDLSVVRLIEKADHSAGRLVNLVAKHFPSFRDEARFDGRKVRFLKRAQIFVADIWAAFNGTSYGAFDDIGHLTIFAGK